MARKTDYEPDEEMKARLSVVYPASHFKEEADILRKEYGRTNRYPTGWNALDDYLGGGFGSEHRGELVVLAGETGIGKTTLAANLATRLMANSGQKLHFISLENPFEDIYNIMCKVAGREDLGVYADKLTFPDNELIFGFKAWRSEDLIEHMTYVVNAHNTKIFIIDHLNFMFETEEQASAEVYRVRAIMRKLSRFCMHYKVCVFAISHLNRNRQVNTSGGAPTNDRIYGSGAIAHAGTKVLLLNEQEILGDPNRYVDVRLTKSRYTPGNKGCIRFDATETKWKDAKWVPSDQ